MRNTSISGRVAASVLPLAICAIVATPGAMAASGDDVLRIPEHVRFAMQRDLGIMPGQIPQYLAAQRRAPELERQASATLGDRYAGTWLERNRLGEYEPVIAVAGQRDAAKARALGVQVRVVAHSLAALRAAHARLDGSAHALRTATKGGRLDPGIQSWHVDPRSNRVVVTTDVGATDAAIDFVAASGADAAAIRFETSNARPQPAQQATFDVRGGDRYNLATGGWCSIGFTVTLGAANGFVTAGHCGAVNTAVTHPTGQSLGYIAASVFPGSDYAVVHNTNPLGIPRPWVNAYSYGGNLPIRGDIPATLNAAICRSGARTGARCGALVATGVTVNYGASGIVYNLSRSSACVGTGDSGGSFVTPDGQAQGVTSGGSFNAGTTENCTVGTPITFYQPLRPILAAYPGLTLVISP